MKIAYFGLDVLIDCLKVLEKSGCKIVSMFTFYGDDYDCTVQVRAFAATHQIPCKMTPVTREDITALEEAGVDYTITAGYPYLIPVSTKIRQINIHPAMLPVGRGPWPMPVNILKNIPSGVTLHKLAETFDTGDILLQEEIPLDPKENLETLNGKVAKKATKLLRQFMKDPDKYWSNAVPQKKGEYWPEPTDEDRTILPTDDEATVDRKMRAFKGYGCLKILRHILMEIDDVHTVHPYFRRITLKDREKMEKIRLAYPSKISDYTFALLYSWQDTLELSIYLTDTFYLVKSKDRFFAPIGDPKDYTPFLLEMSALYHDMTFDFCDEDHMKVLLSIFPKAEATLDENGCDYYLKASALKTLEGGKLRTCRKDYRHYASLEPAPEVEVITKENLCHVREIASVHHKEDFYAQYEALNSYEELHMMGILVKRGDQYVSFAMSSEMAPNVLQGHFMKSIDPERGSSFFTMCNNLFHVEKEYEFFNIEDDMGDTGVRHFKQSMNPEMIPSYTVVVR